MKNKDFTKREKDQLVEGLMRRAGLGKHVRKFVNKRDGLLKEGYDPLQDEEEDEEDLFGSDQNDPVDGGAPDAADLPPEAGSDVVDPSADLSDPDTGLGLEPGTPPAQITPEQVAKAVVDALKGLNLVSYEDESDEMAGDELGADLDLGSEPSAPAPETEKSDVDLSVSDDGMGDTDVSVSDEEETDEDKEVNKLAEAIVRAIRKGK